MENVSGSAIYQYVCLLQNAQAIMQARKKNTQKGVKLQTYLSMKHDYSASSRS